MPLALPLLAPGPLIVWRLDVVDILANTATMAGSVLLVLLLLAGCSGIGPGTVTRDRERPGDAFVAVRYRGHWFIIDDHNIPSKRLFSFLMFLFTLVETGGKEGAPIVTIPAQ